MKYVENYWVEELPNGVIHLLVNCTQREIYFHAYNDISFLITGSELEYENGGWGDSECILELDPFIPENKDVIYIRSTMKEKDQLNFFWIPFERRGKRDRKILLESKL